MEKVLARHKVNLRSLKWTMSVHLLSKGPEPRRAESNLRSPDSLPAVRPSSLPRTRRQSCSFLPS